jgi:5-dehydro-2-deoxygluconokinase
MLGQDAPEAEVEKSFALAARAPRVRGFAVGRTIFSHAAGQWLGGRMGDAAAIEEMAERFSRLVEMWQTYRPLGERTTGDRNALA